MIPLRLSEVAAATGGRLTGGGQADAVVDGPVVIDSRQVVPGALFVALPGARADGHDFAGAALAAGATAVLAAREVDGPAVVVDDPQAALGRLARAVVDRIPGLTVVGVTGSAGKTGTKDLIAAVLGDGVVATPGSYNNEIGLPLTALRCTPRTRVLVVEMGARHPGNIRYLCGITPPTVAVVVNVGSAHLEVFGSIEVTAATKGELVAALPPGGVAVLAADDPLVRAMAVPVGARAVFYGRADHTDTQPPPRPEPEVSATQVRVDEQARPSFRLCTPEGAAEVTLSVHGEHHVGNALAAAAVGRAVGLAVDEVARRLSGAGAASRWRMEVTTRADGVTVVNDAYNANPDSARAALEALAAMARPLPGRPARRSWAVFGTMLEVGDPRAAHEEVGRRAAQEGVTHLVGVGKPVAGWLRAGAGRHGPTSPTVHEVADRDEAARLLGGVLLPGDVVLVKASRSIGLDVLAERLAHGPDEGGERGGAAVRGTPPAAREDDVLTPRVGAGEAGR